MIDTDLPESIKIGPYTYKIVVWSELEAIEKQMYGQCNNEHQEIRVKQKYHSYSAASDTFIHECLHVVCWLMGLKDSDDQERTVTTLATGLTMLLTDNPWLAPWLNRFNDA